MDSFVEYMIKKKPDTKAISLTILTIVIALFLFCIVFAYWEIMRYVSLVAWAVILWGSYSVISSILEIEYEFIITNNCLDIDKIVAKKKRIRLRSFDIKNFDKITQNLEEPSDITEFYGSSHKSQNLYALTYTDAGKKHKIIMEINDDMKKAILKVLPGSEIR
ncbi:MAG: hypothetical protein Q8882_06170 [Bacillota bacterium]|nr:hypothetical protein [Bacillota bacterium]